MSRWFRHYAGMMRDDKLVRVAIRSGQAVERVVWIYGAILESATEIDDGGRYDFDCEEAAYFLRASLDDVVAVENALRDSGRLVEGVVAKWSDRQFQSDRSAQRQSRYRERQKAADRDSQSPERKRQRDAGVTSPSRHRDAPETETETDISDTKVSSLALQPEHVVEAWNVMAERRGLPTVRKLTPERKRKLVSRIRQHPLDDWTEAINAIDRNPWLHGDNAKGWRASFDFLLQPSSFTKLIEGTYDRSEKPADGTNRYAH